MEDSIAGTDVGQEGVPQTFPLVGPLHQPGYIHHIQEGRYFTIKHNQIYLESMIAC